MPEPLLTASAMFANAARFSDAYHAALSPLCAETGLPPAAADILLFLANNPGCETAGEICRMRGKKLRPGDRFICGSQAYQIITHESE